MAEFTGERVIPGQVDTDLWNEHLARYLFAARLARGKKVLDLGCGAGYGTAALGELASHALGVDISAQAVQEAAQRYGSPRVQFQAASATATALPDASFDLIVAFEVIEHLTDWSALLQEAKRLLAPGGQFVVSTPNKAYYAESRRLTGPNPFHEHEFEFDEFESALREHFPHVSFFLQNHSEAVVFQPLSRTASGELRMDSTGAEPSTAHFFIAVCALSAQMGAPAFVYLPTSANVLREREQHILKLESELAQKTQWLEQKAGEHARLVQLHEELKGELESRNRWAEDLNRQLQDTGQRVADLQAELAAEQQAARDTVGQYERKIGELEQDAAAKAKWAIETEQRLTAELAAKTEELARCVQLLDTAERTVEERTQWALSIERQRAELETRLAAVQGSRWYRLGRSIGLGPEVRPT